MDYENVAAVEHFECRIYIGGREGYNGRVFSILDVIAVLGRFQQDWEISRGDFCSARVSETTYVAGGYREAGYEISVLNYPRFPKTWQDVEDFSFALARHLLDKLKQNRLTIVSLPPGGAPRSRAVMLEADTAEARP